MRLRGRRGVGRSTWPCAGPVGTAAGVPTASARSSRPGGRATGPRDGVSAGRWPRAPPSTLRCRRSPRARAGRCSGGCAGARRPGAAVTCLTPCVDGRCRRPGRPHGGRRPRDGGPRRRASGRRGARWPSDLGTGAPVEAGALVGIPADRTVAALRQSVDEQVRSRLPPAPAQDRAGLGRRTRPGGPPRATPTCASRSTPTAPTAWAPAGAGGAERLAALDRVRAGLHRAAARAPTTSTAHGSPGRHARHPGVPSTSRSPPRGAWRRPCATGPARWRASSRPDWAGLLAARRAAELCRGRRGARPSSAGSSRPGLGRSAHAALAGLPGFTLAGDLSDPADYLDERSLRLPRPWSAAGCVRRPARGCRPCPTRPAGSPHLGPPLVPVAGLSWTPRPVRPGRSAGPRIGGPCNGSCSSGGSATCTPGWCAPARSWRCSTSSWPSSATRPRTRGCARWSPRRRWPPTSTPRCERHADAMERGPPVAAWPRSRISTRRQDELLRSRGDRPVSAGAQRAGPADPRGHRRGRGDHPARPEGDPGLGRLRGGGGDRTGRRRRRPGGRAPARIWPSWTSRCPAWTACGRPGRSPPDYKVAVLVLTAFSQRELIEDARDAGVAAYLVKPFRREELLPAIEDVLAKCRQEWAIDEEIERLDQPADDGHGRAEDKIETRRLVDEAKGVLMDRHGLSEPDAFSFIQRTAMQTRSRMRDVAQRVVDGDLSPGRVTPAGRDPVRTDGPAAARCSLLDGMSLAFRAYFALPADLATEAAAPSPTPSTASSPCSSTWCGTTTRRPWRSPSTCRGRPSATSWCADYKAGRAETPDDLLPAVRHDPRGAGLAGRPGGRGDGLRGRRRAGHPGHRGPGPWVRRGRGDR